MSNAIISIPYGAIKTLLPFRLSLLIINISIPYSAIKTCLFFLFHFRASRISIPYGAIKTAHSLFLLCQHGIFQFLMVQLKLNLKHDLVAVNTFQFLMVQLKRG